MTLAPNAERRLRQLFEYVDCAVMFVDVDGVVLLMNHEAAALLGGEPDELAGRPLGELAPGGSEHAARCADVRQEGEPASFEDRVELADGVRWLESEYRPCEAGRHGCEGVQILTRDISRWRRGEEAFWEQARESTRALAVFQEGRIAFLNAAGARLTGYSVEELSSMPADTAMVVSAEDRDRVFGVLRAVADGTALPQRLEFRYRSRTGELHGSAVFVSRIFYRGSPASQISYLDITDRKRGEQLERAREERYGELFAAMSDNLYLIDHDWRYLSVNDAGCEAVGMSRQELLGQRVLDLFPEVWAGAFGSVMRRTMTERLAGEVVERFQFADGQLKWFRLRVTPVPDGILCASTDITEAKVEADLQAAQLRLIQRSVDGATDELLQQFLDEAEVLTGSAIGFFHYVLDDQETLALQTWSTRTLAQMCTAEGQGKHYPISQAGVWVEAVRLRRAVIHNDYARLPHRRGLPEGHAPVTRELVVPVMRGERVGAVLGVGNKPGLYLDHDVRVVERLADLAWEIIDRRRAQEALRVSEAKLSAVLEHSFDVVFSVDAAYRLQTMNPAAVAFFRRFLVVDPQLGENLLAGLPAPVARSWKAQLDQALRGEPFVTRESIASDGPGHFFEVAFHPQRMGEEITGVAVFGRDVTERTVAERTAAHERRKVELTGRVAQAFLTASPEAVFAQVLELLLDELGAGDGAFCYLDDEGRLVCPPARHCLFAASADHAARVIPRAAWQGIWGKALTEARIVSGADEPHPARGQPRLASLLAVPIRFAAEPIGLFLLAGPPGGFDVLEVDLLDAVASQTAPVLAAQLDRERRREREARLQAELRQAQKMEAIGRLAGGLAHDLNNILGAIIVNAGLVKLDLDAESDLHLPLDEVSTAVRRAKRLTQQLLAFSRKQIIEPRVLSLEARLDALQTMLAPLIGEDVILRLEGRTRHRIRMDPTQLEQVVMNLAINSRDAMPTGGELVLTVGDTVLRESDCQGHFDRAPGRYVTLTVSDSGEGMAADIVEKIFDPFFTTKGMGEGTGLGLATVYGIVTQHGGFVEVESAPGQGTSFTLHFPAVEGRLEEGDEAAAVEHRGGDETILLVEDDGLLRKVMHRLLERQGYHVIAAASGAEALALIEGDEVTVDLLLTDIVMPGMNGRELAERMVQDRPGVRVLFMSGYPADVIARRGVLDAGIDFIAKPYEPTAVLARIREVLDRGASPVPVAP